MINNTYNKNSQYQIALMLALAFWVSVQSLLTCKVALFSDWTLAESMARVLLSAVSVLLFWLLWYTVVARLAPRWARVLTVAAITGYVLLWFYHWTRLEPLTFLLLFKNSANALTFEAIDFLFSSIAVWDYFIGLAFIIAIVVMQRRWQLFIAPLRVGPSKRAVMGLLVLNLLVNLPFSSSRNEYVELAGSVLQYWKPHAAFVSGEMPYPYMAQTSSSKHGDEVRRPHVFIVMLESFSAEYIDRLENDKEVTPFLNQLKQQSYYVDDFFSVSVETSKGQFATLCSVYPSYKTNVFTSYPANNFRCLSKILAEQGYTNVFMKAFHTLSFENTGEFVRNNDFTYAHGMDETFVSASERERYKFGWGIQDDIFYKKTFLYLDELNSGKASKAPFFVMTMSVTNHMMFDDIPQEQRYIYPEADGHEENYANSMHLTDKYLQTFFAELKKRDYLRDSLVVVLGDNGFPMGQHGNFHNTKTHYNELFKTPLLIWWPDQLPPHSVSQRPHSQLDVAPTLIDLLGIETEHHFVGRSILQPPSDEYFVPLIQPFDGSYLGSIRYPYKFVRHMKTGDTYLYDLSRDPAETFNLYATDKSLTPDELEYFERDILTLQRNEELLKQDRIYPANSADSVRIEIAQKRLPAGEPLEFKILGGLDETFRVELMVNPYAYADERTASIKSVVDDLAASEVPAHYFSPGVNRVSFLVYQGERLRSHFSKDVYVESTEVKLLTELPVSGSQAWGKLSLNRSLRGGPLRINGKVYGFGLGTHAVSNHVVPLLGEFETLSVGFGLDDGSSCGNGAIFKIYADDREIYRSVRLRNGDFQAVAVDVSGSNVVRLSTDNAGDSACDHTNWVNPVLIRAAAPDVVSSAF